VCVCVCVEFARGFLAAARQAVAGLAAAGGGRRQAAGGGCVCVYVCVRVCSLEYMHAWCSRRISVNGS